MGAAAAFVALPLELGKRQCHTVITRGLSLTYRAPVVKVHSLLPALKGKVN